MVSVDVKHHVYLLTYTAVFQSFYRPVGQMSTFESRVNPGGSAAFLCLAICMSEGQYVWQKDQTCLEPTFFLLFITKEHTNMAAPRGAHNY